MRKKGGWLILAILLTFSAWAQNNQPYHLKLLAVQENGEVMQGSDADLYLELKEGSGRVFLETFPLTKLDTQISTRFAKDIACKQFKLNCNRYDFIFTIKAKSNIVAGPSAGAAIAALTTIAILDLNYDQNISLTGTINSGGLIGPVGGTKQKIEAAAENHLQKVLIAAGTGQKSISNQEKNLTLIQYARENFGLEVVEVMDLYDVIREMTGVDLNHKDTEIKENREYTKIMQQLQESLCLRMEELYDQAQEENIIEEETIEAITQKLGKAKNASRVGDFYSAASYCFSNNIQLRTNLYQGKRLNLEEITVKISELERAVNLLEKEIEAEEMVTISDLQTFMIVKERLNDVKEQIEIYHTGELNHTRELTLEELYALLGFAEERFFSAQSWTEFFLMEGKEFIFEETMLEHSCLRKISESEERLQYAHLFLPNLDGEIEEKIDAAKSALNEKEFALCLIEAAQAKAEANAILSVIGWEEELAEQFLAGKKEAAKRIIAENNAEGVFPILGYSYYQYAQTFGKEEKFTTLLYLEYALEMSELSIYFPEKELLPKTYQFKEETAIFAIGFLLGILITLIVQEEKNYYFPRKQRKKILP